MKAHAWAWYLGGGAVLVAIHAVVPVGLGRDAFGFVISLTALLAIAVGLRAHRPFPSRPWVVIALGAGLWILGDLFRGVLELRGLDPFPSVADGVYLAGYVVIAIGIGQLARARQPRVDRRAVLDALLLGVVVTLVLTVAFIEPTWHAEDTLLARIIGAAYPVGDVMLLVQLAHLRSSGRSGTPTLRLLTASIAVTTVADLTFQAAPYLPWLEARAELVDGVFVIAYVLLGASLLHPSIVRATAATFLDPGRVTNHRRQLVVIAIAVAALPVVLIAEILAGREPHTLEAAIAAVLIVVIVYQRMLGMTTEMTLQAERLATLADTDALTGLANLRRLSDELEERLIDERVEAVPLLLVVLDRFNEINETLGQRVGDELLCAVADRVREVVAHRGVVARVGGDTFAIVVTELQHCTDGAMGCATMLRHELVAPFALSDVTLSVDALVGVAIGPEDGATVDELMQRADVAVSVARSRTDRVARYTGRMPFGGSATPHLVSELQQALSAGEIVVHYQPKVLVTTGYVVGVEALVRWQHPVHGLLPPVAFIPAAERTGLIRPLTLHVLDQALAEIAHRRADGRDLSVSVNLSVRDLLDPGFVAEVAAAVDRHGLPREALELEITETMAMVDPERSLEVLEGLADLGVLLSVDDYGTGYSSLAYLQRLPVKRLKIDKQFVTGVVDDRASAAIVRSTIELARHLGMTIVAEGVEDDATLLALKDMGCDAAQGFGLGRPVAAEALGALIDVIEDRAPRVLLQKVPVGRRVV